MTAGELFSDTGTLLSALRDLAERWRGSTMTIFGGGKANSPHADELSALLDRAPAGGEVAETVEYRVVGVRPGRGVEVVDDELPLDGARLQVEMTAEEGWSGVRVETSKVTVTTSRSPWVPVDPAEEG